MDTNNNNHAALFVKLWRALIITAATIFIVSAAFTFVPPLRTLVINAAQSLIVHRPLTAPKWHERFVKWGIKGIKITTIVATILCILRFFLHVTHFTKSSEGVRVIIFPTQRFKKDWKVLLALFCVLFSLRIYYLTQKVGVHVDEGLSVIMSSYGKYGWWQDFKTGKPYTGAEIKRMIFCNDLSLLSTPKTIAKIWWNNRDSPHTNFYYSLLRIFLTGMKDGGIKQIIHRGGALNLLLFAFSFLFAYMLLLSLFKDEQHRFVVFSTLAIIFLTTGSVSNTLFFRPYQLQECTTLLFTICVVQMLCCLRTQKMDALITSKNLLIISFISALFLLSAYASIIFFGIIGLSLVIISARQKQYNSVAFLCFVALTTFAFATCLYPHYFQGFFIDRGKETVKHLEDISFVNLILKPLSFYATQCASHLFYIPAIVLLLVALTVAILQQKTASSKTNTQNYMTQERFAFIFILIATLLWQVLIAVVMPFNDVRHLFASFPLACLVFSLVATLLRGRAVRVFLSITVAMYVLIFPLQKVLPLSPCNPRVEFLYRSNGNNEYKCLATPDVPIVIAEHGCYVWMYAIFFPLLNDEQTIYFAKAPNSNRGVERFIKHIPYDDFFLLSINPDTEEHPQVAPFDLKTFHAVSFENTTGDFTFSTYWYEKRVSKK